jgi:hyperosmotically inducible protein
MEGVAGMGIARTVAVALLLAGMLHGCAALVVGGAAAGGGYYAVKDKRSATEKTGDAAITSAINRKYVNDGLVSAFDINIATYRGVVTLNGTVKTQAAASRAVELARSTSNVKRVVSHIGVQP